MYNRYIMTVTLKDIAKKANLSPASVSRILNNRGRFNDDTAKQVRTIAQSLGYFKNQSAADLSQKQSRVIGVLIPTAHTNFADEIIKGMQNEAYENGYELLITFFGNDHQQQMQTVKALLSRQLLAIFMLAVDITLPIHQLIKTSNIQVLSISNQLNDGVPSISSDNYDMMSQIVNYLYDHGHRQMALIGSSMIEPVVATVRRQGFIDALAKHNIKYNPDFIWGNNISYELGLQTIPHYGTPLPFTAVISSADIISIGILNGAKDAGLQVPNDLSIISIDGTELTQLTRPILTNAKQNFQLMGELAITALINNQLSTNTAIYTDIEIIAGQTIRTLKDS